jgi:hypothetical protein
VGGRRIGCALVDDLRANERRKAAAATPTRSPAPIGTGSTSVARGGRQHESNFNPYALPLKACGILQLMKTA